VRGQFFKDSPKDSSQRIDERAVPIGFVRRHVPNNCWEATCMVGAGTGPKKILMVLFFLKKGVGN
jgi:hypothetical protein